MRYISRKRVDANRRLLQEGGRLSGSTVAGVKLIETIKSSGLEDAFFQRFAGLQAKVTRAMQSLGAKTLVLDQVPVFLMSLNRALILCLGAYDVIQGRMSIGLLVAFQLLMSSFLMPVRTLVQMGSMLQTCEGDMNRIDDVLSSPASPGITDARQAAEMASSFPVPKLDGYLELRDVTFGYSPREAPLMKDFNFRIEPGQRKALVGSTGSGKSTIAKLVLGLYEPWSGEVLFDRWQRKDIPQGILSRSLSNVSQEIFFFEGTIMENLTLWNEHVPEEVVVQAARDACIHETIMARPGGYAHRLGEGGMNFSGGERQRLEIARALASEPSLLILDEATSALDPLTEYKIDRNLRRRGCACLIVAHRLSTIRDSDEIVVLHRGKVVERGRHDELVGLDGFYAELIRADSQKPQAT